MAKAQVGLARNIKLKWLNKTVAFMERTQDINELKELLNEYLGFEITSADNIRKTRDILLNLWVRDDDGNKAIKDEAFNLISDYPDDAMAIHWALILLRYPVFVDTCAAIGRLTEIQESVSLEQIKNSLFDKWGERNTLLHSTSKVIQTIKDLGAMEGSGKYTIKKRAINSADVADFVLKVAMIVDGKSYYTYDDLFSLSFLFPFSIIVTKEHLYESDLFAIHNTGGEMAISLK